MDRRGLLDWVVRCCSDGRVSQQDGEAGGAVHAAFDEQNVSALQEVWMMFEMLCGGLDGVNHMCG
jgi:hypothetical protein